VRLLDRHVLKECALACSLATGAFVFVLLGGNIVQMVLGAVSSGRVTSWEACELIALLFPTVLPYALPMGVLTGVLLTFGRMGADGEITAMKASGVSLWRIAAPVWIVAALLAVASLWLNLEAGPASEDGFQKVLLGSAQLTPAGLIQPGKLNRQFQGLLIRAEAKDGETLKRFHLWQVDEQGKVLQSLRAAEARLTKVTDSAGHSFLKVEMREAKMNSRPGDGDTLAHPESFVAAQQAILEVPLGQRTGEKGTYVKRLRMMTGGELLAAMETGWQLSDKPTAEERLTERMRLAVQFMFRVATALSVLSLTMLAVPLAVSVGRSETSVSAGLALGVALTYYLLTSMATWVKNPAWHPEVLVLLPNILLAAIACLLMRKAARH
jgi:lipopolysaccharide export system permease protein